jgi:hypothetical protein
VIPPIDPPIATGRAEASPTPSTQPIDVPIGRIEHATGLTDVVLRFDSYPDYGICELCGGWGPFTPGPEFTLYGDGTVIFRNDQAEPPPAEGPIIRATAFKVAHLDENRIQSLLRFALGEGGLWNARERYEAQDTDPVGSSIFTIRAGGIDKRVEVVGSHVPFDVLTDYLRTFDERVNVSTRVWMPDHYWGLLIEVGSWIKNGVLSEPADTDVVSWPWRGTAPGDFARRPSDPIGVNPRRVMSSEDASVLGLSDNGGVVQRIYLRGPDNKTIYSFSLWPMLPDETT